MDARTALTDLIERTRRADAELTRMISGDPVPAVGPAYTRLVAKRSGVRVALGYAEDALRRVPDTCDLPDGRRDAEALLCGRPKDHDGWHAGFNPETGQTATWSG